MNIIKDKKVICELRKELIHLNTEYQKDYSPKLWIMTQYDIDNPMHILTEQEVNNRHIGAITAIQRVDDKLKELYEKISNNIC